MSLALAYFGVSAYISVPIAAVGLVAITASGSFRRWERFMFIFVVVNLLVIPLAVLAHPHAGPVAPRLPRPRRPPRVQLDLGPARHRHRGDHRRPLAAVLPAVEHHRQGDHHPLGELRAHRHGPRVVRRGDRGQPPHHRGRLRLRPYAGVGTLRERRHGGPRPGPLRRSRRRRHVRHRSAERLDHRRGGGHPVHLLRLRRRLRRAALPAPPRERGQVLLRLLHRHGRPRRRHRPHPRRPARSHHPERPGPRRRAVAECDRLPDPALQRRARSSAPG